jgi:hypothetical protein
MGVPTLEVGYTSATTGRGDHEVHKGHVVALEKKFDDKLQSSKKLITNPKFDEHLQQNGTCSDSLEK